MLCLFLAFHAFRDQTNLTSQLSILTCQEPLISRDLGIFGQVPLFSHTGAPCTSGFGPYFYWLQFRTVPKAAMLTLTPHRHHDITRYCFRVFRQKLRQKLPRSLGCLHIHAVRAVGILFLLDLTITAPVTTFIPDTFCQLILECARVDLSSLKLLHRPRCSPLELLFSRRKYPVVILRFLSGKP